MLISFLKDVIEILSKTTKGQRAITDIQQNHLLKPTNGKVIAHLCAEHLVKSYGDK